MYMCVDTCVCLCVHVLCVWVCVCIGVMCVHGVCGCLKCFHADHVTCTYAPHVTRVHVTYTLAQATSTVHDAFIENATQADMQG